MTPRTHANIVLEEDSLLCENTELTSAKNLKCLHVNIRSMRKNWDEFVFTLQDAKISWDIIILTEINIKETETSLYSLDSYNSFFLTREDTVRGGGICTFVRNNLLCDFSKFKCDLNDGLKINLNVNDSEFIVLGIYRQPSTNKQKFISSLKTILSTYLNNGLNVILMGDFNINTLKEKKNTEKLTVDKYENMLASLGFETKIDSPTRQEYLRGLLTESCIDHIFVRSCDHTSFGYTWHKKLADHYFTILTLEMDEKNYSSRDTDDLHCKWNDEAIVKNLQFTDWRFLDDIADSNEAYDKVHTIITKIYNENILPVKTRASTKNIKRKPWISDFLISKINRKNHLWKLLKDHENAQLLEQYKKAKNEVTSLIRKAKQNYYYQLINNCENNSKKMWNTVNSITGKKIKANIDEQLKKSFPHILSKDLCNKFNTSFSDKVPLLKQKYQTRRALLKQKNCCHGNVNNRPVQSTSGLNSMGILPASVDEVCTLISETKATSSAGMDGFLIKHFKESKFNSAILVSKLINKIIDTGIWPDKLKIQILRPVYKKGKKDDLDNYRPIALLPVLNKFIEKYFCNKLVNFIQANSLLTKIQFGFRKNLGTNDALKEINDKVSKALNDGKFVGAILIDLQKAFDTVNHGILLNKCTELGIRGKINNIIKSYLSNRKTTTKIGNKHSKFDDASVGVPQGSVLGPLLFLIYVNDITDNILDTLIYLFADDIILISINLNYDTMMLNLQSSLDKVDLWCVYNDVFISENKTLFINICSPQKRPNNIKNIFIHDPACDLNDCAQFCYKLNETDQATYLGFKIDSKWNFKKHIEHTISKLKRLMPNLYHLKNILNRKNKLKIYYAWVESILRYGIELYGLAPDSYIDRLQKTQNKIVKILFKDKIETKTFDIYKSEQILNIKQLTSFVFIYNNFFSMKYKTVSPDKSTILRKSTYKYDVPKFNNEYGKRIREYSIPVMFNKLPERILAIDKLGRLKKELRRHITNHS